MTEKLDNDFGMKCPHCDASDEIDIAATIWIRLCPDGTDVTAAENGDHYWNDDSAAVCQSCGHVGIVEEFDIDSRRPK